MKVTVKGVARAAAEAGLPESVVDRHMDALINYTLLIAKRERKRCQQSIRAWYFNQSKTKPQLFDVLGENEADTL